MSKQGGFGELISGLVEAFMLVFPFGNVTKVLDDIAEINPQEDMRKETAVIKSLGNEKGYAYVHFEGERWKCFSRDVLEIGDTVEITYVDGLTLHVTKIN